MNYHPPTCEHGAISGDCNICAGSKGDHALQSLREAERKEHMFGEEYDCGDKMKRCDHCGALLRELQNRKAMLGRACPREWECPTCYPIRRFVEVLPLTIDDLTCPDVVVEKQ